MLIFLNYSRHLFTSDGTISAVILLEPMTLVRCHVTLDEKPSDKIPVIIGIILFFLYIRFDVSTFPILYLSRTHGQNEMNLFVVFEELLVEMFV